MSSRRENMPQSAGFLVLALLLVFLDVYYHSRPFLSDRGWTIAALDSLMLSLRRKGAVPGSLVVKGMALLCLAAGALCGEERERERRSTAVLSLCALALVLFLLPDWSALQYLTSTSAGFILLSMTLPRVLPSPHDEAEELNDEGETFDQCRRKIVTAHSINIPIRFQYRHRMHPGWINIVNPFRASIVMGIPGSGKSFSIYNPVIEQMIAKGYSMFVYDYKFPDLSRKVYNEVLRSTKWYKRVPEFFVINFKDPQRSNRCNPIDPKYITDLADASEIAEIILLNVSKGAAEKQDFFTMSAKEYLTCLIWYLKVYKDGIYCDFPHLVEFMSKDYETVLNMLSRENSLEAKAAPFLDAMNAGAQDQLQGQIASARIPLNKFVSPALYWVLSGRDFTLDISNPKSPKILCVGNDPDRQDIYGTTLALFTSRLFKIINHKGNRPCGVLLDELPTIFIKGLDNLVNTARSNKVAIVLGAQDKSQLVRDYGEKESEVILNTVGNHIVGAVNGRTAQEYSRSFGKEFRKSVSISRNGSGRSESRSYQLQDILPVKTIEGLSTGFFFGKVVDTFSTRVKKKKFCGEVQIDMKKYEKDERDFVDIPIITDFGTGRIDEDLKDPQRARSLLREDIIQSIRDNWDEGQQVSDTVLIERAVSELDRMTDEQCRQRLEALAPELKRRMVDDVIMDNFYSIKDDISRMIDEIENRL